jgi:hypothetical protein
VGVAVRVGVPGAVKALAVVAVLGVLGFDGASVAFAHVSASDDASSAAHAAADNWHDRHNLSSAFAAASADAAQHHETVDPARFAVTADGTVSLLLHRVATTAVIGRLHPSWTRVDATASATWAS